MKDRVLIFLVCILAFALILQSLHMARYKKQTEKRIAVIEKLKEQKSPVLPPVPVERTQAPKSDLNIFDNRSKVQEKSPFEEMELMARRMNRLFNDLSKDVSRAWPGVPESGRPVFELALDVIELPDSYIIKADIPGMKKEDISVDVQGNMLTISGERKSEEDSSQNGYYRSERSFGAFSKTISLPQDIKKGEIKAEYNNGVLLIRLPRIEVVEQKATKVEIQ